MKYGATSLRFAANCFPHVGRHLPQTSYKGQTFTIYTNSFHSETRHFLSHHSDAVYDVRETYIVAVDGLCGPPAMSISLQMARTIMCICFEKNLLETCLNIDD